MKTADWLILAGILGVGGYAAYRLLSAKKEDAEQPADVRFFQSVVKGDWAGAGEALEDAWEPWGNLLGQYIIEPGSQIANSIADLPAYAYNWVSAHVVTTIEAVQDAWDDHAPDTLYATHVQTTAGGAVADSPSRLSSMR